jgi:hypothetical protein
MKAYKYKLNASMAHFGGVIYRASTHRNVIFDTGSVKWESVKEEIEAAFKAGFLKMTKESAEAYKKDLAAVEKVDKAKTAKKE